MTCEVCGHEQDRGRFCGRCGARVEASDVAGSTAPWSRPERWAPAAIALLVLVVALGRPLVRGGSDEPGTAPATVPVGPVFADPTGTVLFFDDGTTGAVALHLDTGATERLELPGQRPDDRPYRLWRVGEQLVAGSDRVVLVAPGPEGAARTLGDATFFLPAADPEQLWLIDRDDAEAPGGTWTLVPASGQVVTTVEAIAGYEPIRGVPGGLAVRDATGRLWRYDLAGEVLVEALGGPTRSWIGDVVRSQVAWCTGDPCRTLTIAAADGAEPVGIGGDETFSEGEVWLSPDGDQVAAVVLAPAGDGPALERRLRIRRTVTGELLADTPVPLGRTSGSWTVDGRQFFAWIHAVGAGTDAPAVLARWSGTAIELADARAVGVEDVLDVVALPSTAVRGLFRPGPTCSESRRSDAMGPLPAWREERVHVALPRPGAVDPPDQLWVGIPGADHTTTVTVSAELVDGEQQADFRVGADGDWRSELTVRSGMRTADGFPPHWGFASRFPVPGCWAVTVSTEELTETVTMEIRFDVR